MTNLAGRRSYNFGDAFGDAVESDSINPDTLPETGKTIRTSSLTHASEAKRRSNDLDVMEYSGL